MGMAALVGYLASQRSGPPRPRKAKGPTALDPEKKIPFRMIKKEVGGRGHTISADLGGRGQMISAGLGGRT